MEKINIITKFRSFSNEITTIINNYKLECIQHNTFKDALLLEKKTGNTDFRKTEEALKSTKLDECINGNYFAYLLMNNVPITEEEKSKLIATTAMGKDLTYEQLLFYVEEFINKALSADDKFYIPFELNAFMENPEGYIANNNKDKNKSYQIHR